MADVLNIRKQEAVKNGDYSSLVETLINEKSYDDAIKWAEKGIKKTADQNNRTADNLIELLQKIAQRKRQWQIVAAYDAWNFLDSPSRNKWETLLKSAAKAKCKDAVIKFATIFLETGKSPITGTTTKTDKIKTAIDCPLPMPEILSSLMKRAQQKNPSHIITYCWILRWLPKTARPS